MNGNSRELNYGVLEDNGSCRSSEFLRLCDESSKAVRVRVRPSASGLAGDKFMKRSIGFTIVFREISEEVHQTKA